LTFISIVIDRRAFMVSSLGYVVYALAMLIKQFGSLGDQLGLTAVIVGLSLLLMSAFWHKIRVWCVSRLPMTWHTQLPAI